jgi:hypothetical protein
VHSLGRRSDKNGVTVSTLAGERRFGMALGAGIQKLY